MLSNIKYLLIFMAMQFVSTYMYSSQSMFVESLDMSRVNEIAFLLPDQPKGIGNNYKDRQSWDKLYINTSYKKIIEEAAQILEKGFHPWDKSRYDRVFTHGDTQAGKNMINKRLKELSVLVWAECLENKGRFVEIIYHAVYDILNQHTWVNPVNYNERNFGGLVELGTALTASCLSQTVFLLDDKLSTEVRTDLIENLYQRAFNPLLETIDGKNDFHWWLTGTNNWNAACLEGITTAALTLLPDKIERAKFIAIAERYSENFIAGFLDDGYCTEGLSYYNFGISHYNVLREIICQNTNGEIDLFENNKEKLYKIALSPLNMEVVNDIYPAIADSRINTKPSPSIICYFNRTLGLQIPETHCLLKGGRSTKLPESVMMEFPLVPIKKPLDSLSYQKSIRDYFEKAGVLVARSYENKDVPFGVVMKGGNNDEHHNHNDLGSFTIVVGEEMIVEDPGLVPYTIKTFSNERYQAFKTLSSYGHPVPRVAGKEQKEGAESRAVIISESFLEAKDKYKMDIASAYQIESLKELTREFIFNRDSVPFFEVVDEFLFSDCHEFETAITTRATWELIGSNRLMLKRNNQKVKVVIDTSGAEYDFTAEEISEGGEPYTRIAVKLKEKSIHGIVRMKFLLM